MCKRNILFFPQSVFKDLISSGGVSVASSLFVRKKNMTGIIQNKMGGNERMDVFYWKPNVSLK